MCNSTPEFTLRVPRNDIWAFILGYIFVIWVGLLISWLFFSGIKPPLAS